MTNNRVDQEGLTVEIYQRVLALHGELNPIPPRREALHELISTILSHRTTNADEAEAFRRMWARYGSWQAIMTADEVELAEVISPATFPEPKAKYIIGTLTEIYERRDEYNIDFLAEESTDDALEWLTSLPGVGVKTATLVLLFNFQHSVIPVDTHVHRITQRIGLIGPKVSADKAHQLLLNYLPEDPFVLFNFHKGLLRHGQRICSWKSPKCHQCNMTDICAWFRLNRT